MEDRQHVAHSTLSSLLTSCLAVHCLTNKSNIIVLSSQQSSKDHYTSFRGQQLRTLYVVLVDGQQGQLASSRFSGPWGLPAARTWREQEMRCIW